MPPELTQLIRRKTGRWVFRRTGVENGEVLLVQRRVFILPTGAGMGFCALLLLLLVGSINYNLGLGFALTFLAATCWVADIWFTYRNLAQLRLRLGRVPPVFAGELAQLELRLLNRTRLDRYAVWVDFDPAPEVRHVTDVAAAGSAVVTLTLPTAARGWLAAPRVRLDTRFPLGLFRAWSYWRPDARVLVYPFPEETAPPLPVGGAASVDGIGHAGDDNFAGIRSYQPGDALRHLAWRQIARLDPAYGGQLATKHFEGGGRDELVLDFDAMPTFVDLELRLSRMARWVLDAEKRGLPYAFRIDGRRFGAASGDAHRAACLRALALYGIAEDE
ncbi:DUF58 domain-containing protein [Massilia cavernae]|uniref:DUF58 domain-containing protein n=1 Tax=Massilia cavernae TaxID=2320864 RepID=A0A418XRF9_9BURK|nr:DUF58 domain-containing protein [Massilia cavernae]RJG15099.1 DUF58 domain-containing protein [Massilia cavernae]